MSTERDDRPLETPHAFSAGDPAIWGPRCRLCGMLPSAERHGSNNHDPGDEDRS